VLNDLRSRIWVQTDGQIKTGRDVMVAALLGADEMGFSTAPLIATGCVMMRACHLNTCPVGVATQDPELRKRFEGTPEHVVNFFFFVAEEVRELMRRVGVRRFEDLTGRVDLLKADDAIEHWKARGIDLTHVLNTPEVPGGTTLRRVRPQESPLPGALDWKLIEAAKDAIDHRRPVTGEFAIRNVNRTVGGLLSSAVTKVHGFDGLDPETIRFTLRGSAGQSFGAWLAPGVELTLIGDANDYTGKGLSGGVLAVRPPDGVTFKAEENVIIGNTVLYGATAGRAFFRGLAGERFAVRNSGARAVVEGVGDHGCEYMTGGRVVVLGPTGRNFAAGMSGGVAYVLDEDGTFGARCNMGLVGFDPIEDADAIELHDLIEEHHLRTQSTVAARILRGWTDYLPKFVKVMPHDYKRALAELAETEARSIEDGESTGGEGFVATEQAA
jgi:glutamate synthase domain-containing protein 3